MGGGGGGHGPLHPPGYAPGLTTSAMLPIIEHDRENMFESVKTDMCDHHLLDFSGHFREFDLFQRVKRDNTYK